MTNTAGGEQDVNPSTVVRKSTSPPAQNEEALNSTAIREQSWSESKPVKAVGPSGPTVQQGLLHRRPGDAGVVAVADTGLPAIQWVDDLPNSRSGNGTEGDMADGMPVDAKPTGSTPEARKTVSATEAADKGQGFAALDLEQWVRVVPGAAEPPLPATKMLSQAEPTETSEGQLQHMVLDTEDHKGQKSQNENRRTFTTPRMRLGKLTDSPQNGPTRRDSGSAHSLANGSLSNGFLHAEDELDWRLSPASKRRRTTIGRPQTSKAPGDYVANLMACGRRWEEDPRSLEELVEALKRHFYIEGEPLKSRVLLGQIMRSGVLAGQPLTVKPADGSGIEISGHVMESGKISCECTNCSGDTVRISEFEEHSGASERHLSHSIQLANHGISVKVPHLQPISWLLGQSGRPCCTPLGLSISSESGEEVQELCERVNAACGWEGEPGCSLHKPLQQQQQCRECRQSGTGLLRCGGGCKERAHPECIGFDKDYAGPWSCSNCMAERTRQALDKLEEARAKAARRAQKAQEKAAEARLASCRMHDTPRVNQHRKSQGSKPSSTSRGNPQRVHMAAPTAKVGLSQGRMVRNSNKHKRLFDPDEPNGVKTGEKVVYKTTQGEVLLDGEIRVSRSGPCGILCACCDRVISCSQFEAHAGRGSRRAPYDNIFTMAGISLRRLAAALPSDAPIYHAEDAGQPDAVQEDMLGGCVLCEEKNFQRDGFSDLTVILCDQCEREFHVGCLRKHKDIDLQGLPGGDWFCSGKCQQIHSELRKRVQFGPMDINSEYQWQLLHGKDGSHSTTWALKACYEILQESFDPIIDQVSGQDLVKGMVFSVQQGEWDHTGMFAAILRYKKQPVCSLVVRAFGDMLAEVPLIATRTEARRKGHARFLMNALSHLLAEVGVRTLSLPAAHTTVETWTLGFSFKPMAADQLLETRESLRLMVFPGTEVLYKVLLPEAEPYPAPVRAKAPKPIAGSAVPDSGAVGAPDAAVDVPNAEPAQTDAKRGEPAAEAWAPQDAPTDVDAAERSADVDQRQFDNADVATQQPEVGAGLRGAGGCQASEKEGPAPAAEEGDPPGRDAVGGAEEVKVEACDTVMVDDSQNRGSEKLAQETATQLSLKA